MKPLTGLDEEVSSYVLKFNENISFREVDGSITFMLPHYKEKQKSTCNCNWMYRWTASFCYAYRIPWETFETRV